MLAQNDRYPSLACQGPNEFEKNLGALGIELLGRFVEQQ